MCFGVTRSELTWPSPRTRLTGMRPRERAVGSERDPEFIRAHLDKLAFVFEHYHQASVEGLEHIPRGRALVVGNHSGGTMSPDMFALMLAWWRHFGVEEPAYALAHDLALRVPGLGKLMRKVGAVNASQANATELLRRDAKVLVYPGGDIDAYRPWSRRHEIVFGERVGFIRVALRTGSPIVPVVAAGSHDALRVLTDGRAIAQKLRLDRLARVDVFPIALCLPWGLLLGPNFYLPLPVNVRIRVLPPMQWPSLGPEDADDDAVVRRCRDEVLERMQTALDELVREGGHGPRCPCQRSRHRA